MYSRLKQKGTPPRAGQVTFMKNIAIFGFGVVGGGIPDVIESCRDGIRAVVGDDINVIFDAF